MNILNLSTFDTGGAGDYALQMNKLFQNEGHNSFLVVRSSLRNHKNDVRAIDNIQENLIIWVISKTKRWFQKKINGVNRKKIRTHFDYYFFQNERDEYVSAERILQKVPFNPDVIILYWISEFITVKTINKLNKLTGAQIFWMMMDNSPITGGCHYPWDCRGFNKNCSNCPAIIEEKSFSIAIDNLALKHRFLPTNLTFIAFSDQDFNRALSASLCKDRNVVKIIGFVDEDIYKPGNKEFAKVYFGIESDKKVLLFGASRINEKRKGLDLLLNAIELLKEYIITNNIILIYAGAQEIDFDNLSIKKLGFLSEDELVLAYQAADVFVCPSIEDSGPMMINQSLMCGTPVVAFESGIALDLVENGKTGYLAQKNDYFDLSNGIREILELIPPLRKEYHYHCIETGVNNSGKQALKRFVSKVLIQGIDG